MKKPLIKIYGERNTGTNYLYKLIELNLEAKLLRGEGPESLRILQKFLPGHEFLLNVYYHFSFPINLGWKHSIVKPVDTLCEMKICKEHISFITITKNPYSWALSLYKRPYHYHYHFDILKNPKYWLLSLVKRPYHYSVKKWTFEDFLISPWLTTMRENAPKEIANPILLWNQKNASYVQLKYKFPCINLNYEDLLLKPESVIEEISDKFKLRRKSQKFKNLTKSTKGDKKDFSFYQRYYLEEKWKENLSHEAVDIINKYLGEDLLNYYCYKKLTCLG